MINAQIELPVFKKIVADYCETTGKVINGSEDFVIESMRCLYQRDFMGYELYSILAQSVECQKALTSDLTDSENVSVSYQLSDLSAPVELLHIDGGLTIEFIWKPHLKAEQIYLAANDSGDFATLDLKGLLDWAVKQNGNLFITNIPLLNNLEDLAAA